MVVSVVVVKKSRRLCLVFWRTVWNVFKPPNWKLNVHFLFLLLQLRLRYWSHFAWQRCLFFGFCFLSSGCCFVCILVHPPFMFSTVWQTFECGFAINYRTAMGSVRVMSFGMGLQIIRAWKIFLTNFADVVFHSCVFGIVAPQISSGAEICVTSLTMVCLYCICSFTFIAAFLQVHQIHQRRRVRYVYYRNKVHATREHDIGQSEIDGWVWKIKFRPFCLG